MKQKYKCKHYIKDNTHKTIIIYKELTIEFFLNLVKDFNCPINITIPLEKTYSTINMFSNDPKWTCMGKDKEYILFSPNKCIINYEKQKNKVSAASINILEHDFLPPTVWFVTDGTNHISFIDKITYETNK